jgi:hypothetical protein
MTYRPPWHVLLVVAALVASGTGFRIAIYVEGVHSLHNAGPVLLGAAVTSGLLLLTIRERRRRPS